MAYSSPGHLTVNNGQLVPDSPTFTPSSKEYGNGYVKAVIENATAGSYMLDMQTTSAYLGHKVYDMIAREYIEDTMPSPTSETAKLMVLTNGRLAYLEVQTLWITGPISKSEQPNNLVEFLLTGLAQPWDIGHFVVHSGEQVGGYVVGDSRRQLAPQARHMGYTHFTGIGNLTLSGPNGTAPVRLLPGQAAQFTMEGDYTPASSYSKRAKLNAAFSGPVDDTGVFLASSPGHYKVGIQENLVEDGSGVYYTSNSVPPIDVYVISPKLVPDYNRDGVIDESDETLAAAGMPFRFWVNDDNDGAADSSGTGGEDLPGSNVDNEDSSVNTIRDLVDFIPVHLQIKDALDLLDASGVNYDVRLTSNVELEIMDLVMPSNYRLKADNCSSYLTDPDRAVLVGGNEVSTVDAANPLELSPSFLTALQSDPMQGMLLVEAHQTNLNAELKVELIVDDSCIVESLLPLALSSVTNMFRFKTLRGDGRADALDEPSNYPDILTSGKDFVFVHGYNVDADSGDATHAEVFKRMYQSGFDGKFWGVSWFGNAADMFFGDDTSHYHHSVVQAFAHVAPFWVFLATSFDSPPDLAAHSLGNGLVGLTLNDAQGTNSLINNYFALDAAMALECYGEIANSTNMVCGESFTIAESPYPRVPGITSTWNEYPEEVWASEWHELFDSSDARSTLTWRNRMSNAVYRVNSAYNFYSSTEEVLRVDENCRSYWSTLQNWEYEWPPVEGGYYAWQIQEWYKGTAAFIPSVMAGGASRQAGWGVVEDISSMHMEYNMSYGYMLRFSSWVEDQLASNEAAYKNDLRSDPFFKHEPEVLFTTNGSAFVSDFVMNQAAHLDYKPQSTDLVKVRDWLLAKGFPARTRPMGSSFISPASGWISVNMASDDSDDYGLMLHEWPRSNRYIDITGTERLEWRHGDFKDVAYPYVQELYKAWADLCE
jgi:hypothetical protein